MAYSHESIELTVDGVPVTVDAGATVLDACDQAGRYVPRLCSNALSKDGSELLSQGRECGLCLVRVGFGSPVRACTTSVAPGLAVTTEDPDLQSLRLARLSSILARHPHICLSCPDRDGCPRDECAYGHPPEARCCGELGLCELGKVVNYMDPGLVLPRKAVVAGRRVVREGQIRRTEGLCVGCGRCVIVCREYKQAGKALKLTPASVEDARTGGDEPTAPVLHWTARPTKGTLRSSGCTFCGVCVMVCPAGALTAPGDGGALWLKGRRESGTAPVVVLPPQDQRTFTREEADTIPHVAGVLQLLDREGQILRIDGVADLHRALARALSETTGETASYFQIEPNPLYTQRESELLALYVQQHGHLPPGNDLGDGLFTDDTDCPQHEV